MYGMSGCPIPISLATKLKTGPTLGCRQRQFTLATQLTHDKTEHEQF